MKREKVEKALIQRCKEYYQNYLYFHDCWIQESKDGDKKNANYYMDKYIEIDIFLVEINRPIPRSTYTRWRNEYKKGEK